MRWIVLAFLVCVFGCDNGPLRYNGQCRVEKLNGKVSEVEITVKNANTGDRVVFRGRNRDDMDDLITGLESLLEDAKLARDEMDVVEPPLERKQ